jgi:hypothetical protein
MRQTAGFPDLWPGDRDEQGVGPSDDSLIQGKYSRGYWGAAFRSACSRQLEAGEEKVDTPEGRLKQTSIPCN